MIVLKARHGLYFALVLCVTFILYYYNVYHIPVHPRTQILIGAAASLQDIMEEIELKYEQLYPEIDIIFTYAGSGTLQEQVQQGAPIDVLITAALSPMKELEKQQLISQYEPLIQNKMVLIVPKSYTGTPITFQNAHTVVERIGIGDPSSVPAGNYAKEILEEIGNYDAILKHAVLGLDVRQVVWWVQSGNVDAGIVYQTDVYTTNDLKIADYEPESNSLPVIYGIGTTTSSSNSDDSTQFMQFCLSPEIQDLFIEYGFTSIRSEE